MDGIFNLLIGIFNTLRSLSGNIISFLTTTVSIPAVEAIGFEGLDLSVLELMFGPFVFTLLIIYIVYAFIP